MAIVDDILHRVDVCTVLESHAVYRAARLPGCDLRAAAALVADLDDDADPPHWHRQHTALHRSINDAAGNLVLAAMVERMHHEVEALYRRCAAGPLFDAGGLRVLQSHHRALLTCVRGGLADESVRHVRVHAQLIREQVIAALTLRV